MEKYTKDVNRISQTFLGQTPEEILEVMKPVRIVRVNRRMDKFIGEKIHNAGMDFVERLNRECGIGATQEELEEEQRVLKEQNAPMIADRPELTVEYLKSIGREDMASW